ncbi:SusC/RagA family TonB-linked outer membrane protein [Botryobacter ruber]|uniref:SusC/RagA family TonB-linked outer membrane protein n=1 Tax=Botryobacter ruber TaxID=2171629 RepID=UPI001F0C451D|nr:SusC/RagA family TonB-linked outer membrane protein [Botryobacter ruber]
MKKKVYRLGSCGMLIALLCGLQPHSKAQSLAFTPPSQNVPQKPGNTATVKLKDALHSFREYYKVDILFSDQAVKDLVVPESVIKLNLSLEQNLELILKSFDLQFKKSKDGTYLITPATKSEGLPVRNFEHAQLLTGINSLQVQDTELAKAQTAKTVAGRITDDKGDPIPGVTVLLKGTSTGTATDVDGKYLLTVPSGEGTLLFSFVGYQTKEVPINNRAAINVTMSLDYKALEEVVVIGYGTVKKSDLTGAVVSVTQEQITSTPVTNVLESLQGKVAGLDLTRSSGETGAAMSFTLRGNRSLRASNAPLIIVDGIQYSSYVDINPNDIASVEVLKDASSTAIYGSRGANGVILITTKGGQAGKTKIEFNNYVGVNTLTAFPSITNTPQLVDYWREEHRSAGQWSSPADDPKIFNDAMERINNGVNTNWVDLMVHNGTVQNNHIAISGGSEKTTFRLSSEFFKEKGLLVNDQLNRFVQHLNIDHQVADRVKIGTIINFNTSKQDRRNTSFWNLIKNSPLGMPYNEDGTIRKYPFPGGSLALNPLFDESAEDYVNKTTINHLFWQGFGDLKIMKNLSFRTNIGVDINSTHQGVFESANTTLSGVNSGFSRAAQIDNKSNGFTWENFLTYNAELNNHAITVMAGNSLIKNRATLLSAEGKNQPYASSQFYNLGTNSRDIITNSRLTESALSSFFGRVNYKFKDRYLLTGSLRADGSSVLAEGHKWAYFPSVAVAWRLVEEPVFSGLKNVFSDLKIRTSYGVSGNSAVTPYQTQGSLSRVAFSFDETAAFGYWPKLLANKELGWETTATLNFGLDFSLFSNRISGTVDAYSTKTDDLLMDRILPSLTGYSSTIANIGKTKTHGIDVVLSSVNVATKNFTWTSDFNISTFNEQIVELSRAGNDIGNRWFIGQPTRVFYDYEKIGIWQQEEADEALKYHQNNKPGMIKVKDQDGDGKITADKDMIIVGQATPKWTGGFNNNFTYKNLSLSVLTFARVGQTISSDYHGYFYPGHTAAVVDYWTPENPTNAYPRPSRSADPYLSTLKYKDGSFIKIKDVRLAYNFKTQLGKGAPLDITLYGTAKNYFTFSRIGDYDPERGGSLDFPLTKQLVFGLNIGL